MGTRQTQSPRTLVFEEKFSWRQSPAAKPRRTDKRQRKETWRADGNVRHQHKTVPFPMHAVSLCQIREHRCHPPPSTPHPFRGPPWGELRTHHWPSGFLGVSQRDCGGAQAYGAAECLKNKGKSGCGRRRCTIETVTPLRGPSRGLDRSCATRLAFIHRLRHFLGPAGFGLWPPGQWGSDWWRGVGSPRRGVGQCWILMLRQECQQLYISGMRPMC